MYFKLNKYQFESAISDIEYGISELADYQVYERIELEKAKLLLLKNILIYMTFSSFMMPC